MKGILFLAAAILSEVFGSTMLKLSEGFSVPVPAIGVVIGFASSFTFLSFSLKTLALSSAYATWAGTGTALTAGIGYFLFNEPFNTKTVIGLVLVIYGVFLLNHSKKEDNAETRTRLTIEK
ncbi:DMT family transporter [Bacillus glycinifermentans]|uniref:SMR family multidrug efflux transporter EbrB n=1 Tax=Bacillus glycinifermentans TaxID=1664069 RepID=UPI001FF4A92D|nr:multidrug efflux SMR transporter [Bacillus glycinifermentans]MEC3609468.1 multidrug efflux SMR transporter [Bacillus glycinifermentans]UOY89147.1 multidrug efflux SMR transporter [Bacillus glycinifermentans]